MDEKNKQNKDISAEELLKLLKNNMAAANAEATDVEEDNVLAGLEPAMPDEDPAAEAAAMLSKLTNDPIERVTEPETRLGRIVYRFRKSQKAPEVIVAAEGRQLEKEIEQSEAEESLDELMQKYLPREALGLNLGVEEESVPEPILPPEAKPLDAFERNSILKEIQVIQDASVPTEPREDENDLYDDYRRRAEQSKIDIKKRISDAEAYVSDISKNEKEHTEPDPQFDLPVFGEESSFTSGDTEVFDAAKVTSEAAAAEKAPEEETSPAGALDETDLKLLYAFGDMDELEKALGKEKAQEINRTMHEAESAPQHPERQVRGRFGEEYTSAEQNKEVFAKYRGEYSRRLWSMLGAAVLMIVTFLFENIGLFGGSLPNALNTNDFPVVYTMISLQLLVLCGALLWKQLFAGAKAIGRLKAIPETGYLALVGLGVLYHIACLFVGPRDDLRGFNFPVALCAFLVLLYDFLNLRREIFTFGVISTKREKYALRKLSGAEANLEKNAFVNYLDEDGGMYRVDKTGFVDNFFVNSEKQCQGRGLLSVLIPAAAVIALVFGVTAGIVAKDFYIGLCVGYITALMAMPLTMFITYSLPFFKASKHAYRLESAVVGEDAFEATTDAMLVSFDDREVFPSYCVKVKSIKVYGDNRIDKIVYTLASLFHKVGGSLSEVLDLATLELGHSDGVTVTEVDEDGLEAMVDGTHIFVGKSGYLRKKGFIPVYDQSDEDLEDSDSDISMMFLVVENEVAAKIYVEYVIDPDFEFLIKQLYKSGVCVGIRSFDPNINNEMISRKVRLSKYPVKVLKCGCDEEITAHSERMDATVVSRNSVKNLLTTFTLYGKVMHVVRIGTMIMIGALVLSMVVAGFIIALGSAASVPSAAVVLYHLFWIAAMLLLTKFLI